MRVTDVTRNLLWAARSTRKMQRDRAMRDRLIAETNMPFAEVLAIQTRWRLEDSRIVKPERPTRKFAPSLTPTPAPDS